MYSSLLYVIATISIDIPTVPTYNIYIALPAQVGCGAA